jgi:hypothetical protein
MIEMKNWACPILNLNLSLTAVTICLSIINITDISTKKKIICAHACTLMLMSDILFIHSTEFTSRLLADTDCHQLLSIDRQTHAHTYIYTEIFPNHTVHWWQHRIIENEFMSTHIDSCGHRFNKKNFIIIRLWNVCRESSLEKKKSSYILITQSRLHDMHQSFCRQALSLFFCVCCFFWPLELELIWADVILMRTCNMKRKCIRMWHPFKRVFTVLLV